MEKQRKIGLSRLLALVFVLCTLLSLAVPASAKETNKVGPAIGFDEVEYGVFKFNWMWNDVQNARGSAFLINENTIVTAAHCLGLSEAEYKAIYNEYGITKSELQEQMKYAVTVERDLTVGATVINYSENMDFAILELERPITTRKYLLLRDSKEVKKGDPLYSIGFPAYADDQKTDIAYTVGEATIKDGIATSTQGRSPTLQTSEGHIFEGEVILTNCELEGGDSGGPMVDTEGRVVGISVAGVTDIKESVTYYHATAIDQVMRACDSLGIDYYTEADVAPQPTETVKPTEAETVPATTVAAEPPATTEVPTETVPVCEICGEENCTKDHVYCDICETYDCGKNHNSSMTTILIIAAAAVAVVVIAIIVMMSKSKKKAAASRPVPQENLTGGFTAPTRPNPPADAGETSVLTQDAGETTLLTHNVNAGTLIRKSTGENIKINAETFVIGRERSQVNYCISDNSSISRTHAKLIVRGGSVYLMDMKAGNGTFVNGVKAMPNQEIALKNGDKITLSNEDFEYRS